MRRIALLSLALTLSGCGYHTWWNPPFTTGSNPNAPVGDSETMLRARGETPKVAPLATQPGDIWPGALPKAPTLQDLVNNGVSSEPEQPAAGSPQSLGTMPPMPSPNPGNGSSTPPAAAPYPSSSYVPAGKPAAKPSYATPHVPAPTEPHRAGRVITTPNGAAVTTGGGPGYDTATTPGGGKSIIVPNGNGTSTVIYPDGRIETIPTPK